MFFEKRTKDWSNCGASLERSGRPEARLDAGVTQSLFFDGGVVELVETFSPSKMAQSLFKKQVDTPIFLFFIGKILLKEEPYGAPNLAEEMPAIVVDRI